MKPRNGNDGFYLFQIFVFLLILVSVILMSGCGGGGGGDDEVDEGMWDGGGGTGVDNAVTFWRYYGELETGEIGHNNAVNVTSDGGFVAAGMKADDFSEESRDYFIVKTDEQGFEQWRLAGRAPDGQDLNDIRQTADGGVIAVGWSGSGTKRDGFAVKADASGGLQWTETYDAGGFAFDEAHAVCVLTNGYAIAGGGSHDISTGDSPPFIVDDLWFFKVDAEGDKVDGSDRFFSLPGSSRAYAMEKTRDGGFILTGIGPPNSVLVIRLNADGDEIWSGLYGTGIGYAVAELPAPDNGFIVAGATPPFAETASDVLIVKIDASGNELWHKVFGGAEMDIGHGVAVYPSGDMIVVSQSRSFSTGSNDFGRDDFYMIKLDKNGDTIWQKVKGISPNNGEAPLDVAVTPDGGFVIAGQAQAMNILAKFDKNGDTIVLGDLDFTFTVGETVGLINMGNARGVAEKAGEFVSLPIEIGSFPVDLLIETLNGMPVSDLCNAGGAYIWNPVPEMPISAGDSYTVNFTECGNGPTGDQSIYNGFFTIGVQQISGDITSDDYEIRIQVNPVEFTFTDDVGGTAFSGGLTYSRIATGGDLAERVETDGNNLTFSDDDSTETLTQLDINATRTETGGFSIGNAGQYAIFNTNLVTGPLKMTVEASITGTEVDAPANGRLLVEAQDGSFLTISFDDGAAAIEVDTDADGVIDGTMTVDWTDSD